jgi:hypothetical protein
VGTVAGTVAARHSARPVTLDAVESQAWRDCKAAERRVRECALAHAHAHGVAVKAAHLGALDRAIVTKAQAIRALLTVLEAT